jgi:hypothetical protein
MVRQHQTTAAVAITLALAASLAPTASGFLARTGSAMAPTFAGSPAPCGDVCSGHGYGIVSSAADVGSSNPVSHANQAGSPAPCGDVCSAHGYGFVNPQPTTVQATSGGAFNWGDAGIGAGACVVLLGIGLAGIRTAAKGRKRHPAEQREIATG